MSDETSPDLTDADARSQMRRATRRGFIGAGVAAVVGYFGVRWLTSASAIGGVPWPLRRILQFNESLAASTFDPSRLSPTFPADRVQPLRTNGQIGLGDDFDPAAWRLRVEGLTDSAFELTLDDLQDLPRHEMITELRCIEGWAVVNRWAGARLADLVTKYAPDRGGALPAYVALETPDGKYYVGLDRPSALHEQTLLCTEMNGEPLSPAHGAPLRLAIPVKYGVKNLKRIGTLRFTDVRPHDYWAERGYDYYAGF